MTDFYSQNRCVCSTRSHGPLLCAFCLSFHFKLWIDILLFLAILQIQKNQYVQILLVTARHHNIVVFANQQQWKNVNATIADWNMLCGMTPTDGPKKSGPPMKNYKYSHSCKLDVRFDNGYLEYI